MIQNHWEVARFLELVKLPEATKERVVEHAKYTGDLVMVRRADWEKATALYHVLEKIAEEIMSEHEATYEHDYYRGLD